MSKRRESRSRPSDKADPLAGLKQSVADGSAIDWDRLKGERPEPELQGLFEQLRVVETIAKFRRNEEGQQPPVDDAKRTNATTTQERKLLDRQAADLGEWRGLTLIEEIGRGAFGIVYRAHDPHLDRPVAVKLLQRTSSTDEKLVSRLLREGQTLARVRHPSVVTVFGAGSDDGRVGLWMEFVRGQTLEQMLATHGPLSAGEAGLVGYELCGALAAVHYAGLVHRDVKAQNVMREQGGRLVLVDFGATQKRTELAMVRGRIAGTPLYLAPEVLNGADASPQSDVYSLGVLLYHLVTDGFPVKAASLDELKDAHARGEITPLEEARPHLPESFIRIVKWATHRNPARRYDGAVRLQEALARFRADRGDRNRKRIFPPKPRLQLPAAVITRPGSPSVAVLPFSDMSPAKDQESFCDGITEELINALTQIRGLRVVARASAFQFKRQARDIRQIGERLNVAAVLDGSVQKHGDQLRITVELIGASDGYLLWSQRFDRNLEDVFTLQDEISVSIVRTLKGTLITGLPATALAPRSKDFDAYASYLEGRYHWNKRTDDSLKKSIGCFERAIGRDPHFAPAYAGLADAYVTLGTHGCLSAKDVMPHAMSAVDRALALDGKLAEAHACRACIRAVYDWSWADAERDFRHAIEVNPSYPTARHWYAINHLVPLGRFDEASEELRRALELDPLSLPIKTSVGMKSYFAGRYDDAVRELSTTLELDEGFAMAHRFLGATYIELSRYPEALKELDVAAALGGRSPEILAALGYLHGASGDVAAARRILEELTRLAGERYVSPARLAQVHVGIGERAEALDHLEEAHAERAADLAWVGVRPVFARLRDEPRFAALLSGTGLGAAAQT